MRAPLCSQGHGQAQPSLHNFGSHSVCKALKTECLCFLMSMRDSLRMPSWSWLVLAGPSCCHAAEQAFSAHGLPAMHAAMHLASGVKTEGLLTAYHRAFSYSGARASPLPEVQPLAANLLRSLYAVILAQRPRIETVRAVRSRRPDASSGLAAEEGARAAGHWRAHRW